MARAGRPAGDELPDDPPGRGTVAFLPVSSPPTDAEVEAALTAFYRDTDEPWPLILGLFGDANAGRMRAQMRAALEAAGACCAGRKGERPVPDLSEPWDIRQDRERAEASDRLRAARDDLLVGIGETLTYLMRNQPVQGMGPDKIRAAIRDLYAARQAGGR